MRKAPKKSNSTNRLRSIFGLTRKNSSNPRRGKQRTLSYGQLENRLALTTFMITTATDNSTGGTDGEISLREAIIASNTNAAYGDAPAGTADGDVIRFDPSVYGSTMILSQGQIEITDDLLVQGGISNVRIEGNGSSRLFDVTASEKVAFSKMTFANGAAATGAAISATGTGTTLLFEMSFFTNNATGDGGGAIYYANGNMFVTNSVFTNNRASGTSGSGGAIHSASGNVYVTGGMMTSNSATASGGAIEVLGGTFFSVGLEVGQTGAGNSAGSAGSASPGDGGGLHVGASGTGRVTVQGGSFVDNVAQRNGGGMWVGGSATNLFVRPSVAVSNNQALGANVGEGGGGIYNDSSNVYINSASVVSNQAAGANGSGGGIYSNNGRVVASNATINENAARKTGGGVHVNDGFLQLTNTEVSFNDIGTTFVVTDGQGGGIYAEGGADVVIRDGQVANNSAVTRGGGIWAGDASRIFTSSGASISFNTLSDAASLGGGIFSSGYMNINESFIQNNESGIQGGGLYLSNLGTQARINGTVFSLNKTGSLGGGIYNSGSMYVTGSSFLNNEAGTDGGGYFKNGKCVQSGHWN